MRDSWLPALLLLLPLTAIACGSSADAVGGASSRGLPPAAGQAQQKLPLERTNWVLQAYGDAQKPTAVLAGTEVTLVVGIDAGRLGGSAGCNSYGAGYKVEGETITISAIVATKKFCQTPEGVMAQETQYLTLLQAATRFTIVDTTLELFTADGKLLRYVAKLGK